MSFEGLSLASKVAEPRLLRPNKLITIAAMLASEAADAKKKPAMFPKPPSGRKTLSLKAIATIHYGHFSSKIDINILLRSQIKRLLTFGL